MKKLSIFSGALLVLFALILTAATGCVDQPAAFPEGLEPAPATTGQNAAPAVEPDATDPVTGSAASTGENAATSDGTADETPSGEPGEDDAELVKADVGVQKKGHYGDPEGPAAFVTTPVASYFAAQSMIAFRVQVPDALQKYKAMDMDGKGPPDHETFMKDIIQANAIKLPELRPGDEYLYDPATETLMVKKRR